MKRLLVVIVMLTAAVLCAVRASAQINPVGIEIGRKLFGFCEAGFGTMYSGAMAGIGYRF